MKLKGVGFELHKAHVKLKGVGFVNTGTCETQGCWLRELHKAHVKLKGVGFVSYKRHM